jgi:hypothetical protein
MKRSDLDPDFSGAVQVGMGGAWTRSLPDQPGVYAVVLGRPIPRLKGETDILYIGNAGKPVRERGGEPATLRRRWKNRWENPAFNEADLRDVLRELISEGEELSVVFASGAMTFHELKWREAQLLDLFFRDHRELPPLNRAKPALK